MAEVENIAIEDARELVSNHLLWPLVRDFLWNFVPQVHSSWIEGLEIAGSGFRLSANSSPRVKRFILDSLGIAPCFHVFPTDDGSRILLLDGATLELLVKWLGALACAGALRRVTKGATVRKLKEAFSGVYPEVFGYAEYFRKVNVEDCKVEDPDDVICAGWTMLQSHVKDLPEHLRSRLVLKLPKRYSDLGPLPFEPSALRTFNLQLLLKLRFPEAYKLCCS